MTDGTIEDRLALHVNADFAHAMDRSEIEVLVDLFTEDAVYANGARIRARARSDSHISRLGHPAAGRLATCSAGCA